MLLLKRKIREKIYVVAKKPVKPGEKIEIVPMEFVEGSVRIGIEAARNLFDVHRSEVINLHKGGLINYLCQVQDSATEYFENGGGI